LELEQKGINLKQWLSAIKRACLGPDAPTFEIKGPMTLKVRERRKVGASLTNYIFMGGEKFRLADVYANMRVQDHSYDVGASFAPVDLKLAAEISGVTLPLAECLDAFDGLEAFVERLAEDPHAVTERGALAPRPTAAATYERRPEHIERGSW
jgi:hypothetical protein